LEFETMHGYQAYHQHKKTLPTRIDLILTLYRTAIELLDRAEPMLRGQDAEAARPLLAKAQLIVSGLGAGMVGDDGEAANNFRRLYEFVAFQLNEGTLESVVAARRVLLTLREAFTDVRAQAITLEAEGKIPSLDGTHHIYLST
jgi:flagellin-specific chaperone FliS